MQQNGDLAQLAADTDLAKLQIQTNIAEAAGNWLYRRLAPLHWLGVWSRAGVRRADRTVCSVYRKGLVWLYGRVSSYRHHPDDADSDGYARPGRYAVGREG
jgi:hypothetical protein